MYNNVNKWPGMNCIFIRSSFNQSKHIGYTQFIVSEESMLIHWWKHRDINIGKVLFSKSVGNGIIRLIFVQFFMYIIYEILHGTATYVYVHTHNVILYLFLVLIYKSNVNMYLYMSVYMS